MHDLLLIALLFAAVLVPIAVFAALLSLQGVVQRRLQLVRSRLRERIRSRS